MDTIRLLIVEDQAILRISLEILLNMEPDIEVIGTAENGRIAIDLSERLRPDIVLMDIHMPELDGVLATQHIKIKQPEIRVIILTAYQDLQYVLDALMVGAEGYLLKASYPQDLVSGIRFVHQGGTLIPREMAISLLVECNHLRNVHIETAKILSNTKYGITDREWQVLKYIAQGLKNQQIAEMLYLSEGTIKNYISSIYSKLNVRNRSEATQKASQEGMV
jgi:DNA-binding NarL/FixJ family response regulator